jgi:predicted Fe-S protein YdhL (DUF1289 family)
MSPVQEIDGTLEKLSKSPFRQKFSLRKAELDYLEHHGLGTVLDHARGFIAKRLAPAHPENDGKQTPMRGHPVFVAQHATATCCRGCLAKWHGIAGGRPMTADEQVRILAIIEAWLLKQPVDATAPRQPRFL